MKSFGDHVQATQFVENVVHCLENHGIVPVAKQSSKRHKNTECEVTSFLSNDPLKGTREIVTDCLRSAGGAYRRAAAVADAYIQEAHVCVGENASV